MFKLILEGAKDGIDEKLKSPFWGSIILTWLTWNWKIWYVTFFVSEKLTGNKLIYINNIYNDITIYGLNLFPCLGFIFNWIIMPLFLSGLIIWVITPIISHKFLKKHKINKEKEIEIMNFNTKLINAETKNIEAEKNKLMAEIEKNKLQFEKEMEENNIRFRKKAQEYAEKKSEEERKKIESEINDMKKRLEKSEKEQQELKVKELEFMKKQRNFENEKKNFEFEMEKKKNFKLEMEKNKFEENKNINKNWDNEYDILTKKYPNIILILSKLIYTYKGQIKSDNWNRQISEEQEKILDTNGIIENNNEEKLGGNTYKITDKGKYFLKKSTLN